MTVSDIAEFYNHKTVFITGASGFIGKLSIEKLLRISPDLKQIYVLLRAKRGLTSDQRAETFFDYPCFNGLKSTYPEFMTKIKFISGNCSEVNLGLSEDDSEMLKNEVNIIFNLAADVRFNNHLRHATYSNLRSVEEILKLTKEMPHLKAFVHVSTAFTNYMDGRDKIKEDFYEPPMKAEQLYNILDALNDDQIKSITPTLLDKWGNTYIYTKCIAEDLVKEELTNLPITVVRPAIITSTIQEPVPGWIDNWYGLVGVSFGVGLGAIKVLLGNKSAPLLAVPADYVTNNIIAAAWNTYNDWNSKGDRKLLVYNFTGSDKKILTLGNYYEYGHAILYEFCLKDMFSYPYSLIFENYYVYKVSAFFLHMVPAYIADLVLFCLNKKTFAIKKMKKISELLELLSNFSLTFYRHESKNVEELRNRMSEYDKNLLNFNMDDIDWKKYWKTCYGEGRVYLLGEPRKAALRTKIKYILLGIIHYVLVGLFLYCFLKSFLDQF